MLELVLELVQVHVVVTLVLSVLVAGVVVVQAVLRQLRPLLQRQVRVAEAASVPAQEPHGTRAAEPARV